MKLIAITGFAESGKDTTYGIIANQVEDVSVMAHPERRVERRAFADNLKIMAMYALGLEGEDEYLIGQANLLKAGGTLTAMVPVSNQVRSFREHNLSGRKYLQHFGVRAREVFGDTFWIDQVLPKPGAEFEPIWGTLGRNGPPVGLPAIACVTDARFENEAERARDIGGVVLEIVNPDRQSDGHASEQPLPRHLVDYTINNDGTLDDLRVKVTGFLNWMEVL